MSAWNRPWRRTLAMPPVGALVESKWHQTGPMRVVKTEPLTIALTDTLCARADGSLCWFAATDLSPVAEAGK